MGAKCLARYCSIMYTYCVYVISFMYIVGGAT